MNNNQPDFTMLSEPFQSIIKNPELTFKFFDLLPTPIEVFGADGFVIFVNQAWAKMINCKDINLLIGKYNLWKDPVCIELCTQEGLDKAFRGEAVTFPDFPAPIQDLVDRDVIDEKPWEAATMDMFMLPIWDEDKFICTICFATMKSMYKGRADIVDAKKYIDEHWMDKFNDDAVAKAVHISTSHLGVLFRQNTGMTLGDYYKKVKVDHIKEKLADKSLTVAQAFSFCGEDSRGAYARIFKELTGMTPTEYRDGLK